MQSQISSRREKSFRLVLEEKTGKEFLVKFSANNFALSDAEDITSRPLNRGGIANLPFLITLLAIGQKSKEPKVQSPKFLGSDGLFCFISIFGFGSFKNPFTIITSQSKIYFRFKRFLLLVQMKKVISMNYGSSTSSWKLWRWVRLGLILSLRDIYINSNKNPLTKFTSSSRSRV